MNKRSNKIICIYLFVVLICILNIVIADQPGLPTLLYGKVMNSDGSPAAGVTVIAKFTDGTGNSNEISTTTRTLEEDPDGSFVGYYFFNQGYLQAAADTVIVVESEGKSIEAYAKPGGSAIEAATLVLQVETTNSVTNETRDLPSFDNSENIPSNTEESTFSSEQSAPSDDLENLTFNNLPVPSNSNSQDEQNQEINDSEENFEGIVTSTTSSTKIKRIYIPIQENKEIDPNDNNKFMDVLIPRSSNEKIKLDESKITNQGIFLILATLISSIIIFAYYLSLRPSHLPIKKVKPVPIASTISIEDELRFDEIIEDLEKLNKKIIKTAKKIGTSKKDYPIYNKLYQEGDRLKHINDFILSKYIIELIKKGKSEKSIFELFEKKGFLHKNLQDIINISKNYVKDNQKLDQLFENLVYVFAKKMKNNGIIDSDIKKDLMRDKQITDKMISKILNRINKEEE